MTFSALNVYTKRSQHRKEEDEEKGWFSKERNCRSVIILDYTNFRGALQQGQMMTYADIINFEKGSPSALLCQGRCVMCGVSDALIPSQNKNVCRSCDSVPWLVKALEVVVKFCKGNHYIITNA